MRQLAAALPLASLLAGVGPEASFRAESGSKLPHSKSGAHRAPLQEGQYFEGAPVENEVAQGSLSSPAALPPRRALGGTENARAAGKAAGPEGGSCATKTVRVTSPRVLILDPACGTATSALQTANTSRVSRRKWGRTATVEHDVEPGLSPARGAGPNGVRPGADLKVGATAVFELLAADAPTASPTRPRWNTR